MAHRNIEGAPVIESGELHTMGVEETMKGVTTVVRGHGAESVTSGAG